MPRVFGEERNALKLQDNISGSEIILYYRTPTTRERTEYDNASIRRKGRKVVMRTAETRLTFGEKILLGFRSGDFAIKKGGSIVPIASDQDDPHYDPDWKKAVMDNAPDLVMLLAGHVFDSSAYIDEPDDAEYEDPGSDADRD